MKYIKTFDEHSQYEEYIGGGGVLPNVSYCRTQTDVHYNPFRALKFTADGQQSVSLFNTGTTLNQPNVEYSLDNGKTWTTWDYSPINFGGGRDLYVRGNNPNGFSRSQATYSSFVFENSSVTVECTGNIMHLVSYSQDLLTIPYVGCFANLFKDCVSLAKAPELPATTLKNVCYYAMFSGCTSLVEAPELPALSVNESSYAYMFYGCSSLTTTPELPATNLNYAAYKSMFQRCTSLTSAPILPLVNLSKNCYTSMFAGCSSLTTAPELPATTLTQGCYENMFDGCTSLVEAPELPATTLQNYCYNSMFKNCTLLTEAPELQAEILTEKCYFRMFMGCSSLVYVKCLATDISAGMAIQEWMSGVHSGGTFVKKAGVTYPSGASGIPSGWTVEEV